MLRRAAHDDDVVLARVPAERHDPCDPRQGNVRRPGGIPATTGKVESMSHEPRTASDSVSEPTSRRWLLRALPGVVIGVPMLVGLTACGGEGEDEDEGDDD
jgi:hypothetical protein